MIHDAHLHLQDPRLDPIQPELPKLIVHEQIAHLVVNGTRESDWATVKSLADKHPEVIPSYGLHPWWIDERSGEWLHRLTSQLDTHRSAVGEIGLDRWFRKGNMEDQISVFLDQWHLANQRQLPVTVHCLKAWGTLLELIQQHPHQGPGFLLHSYSGPVEMVDTWVQLGARFSISGHFAHARKLPKKDIFSRMPLDRILIETDAPDMTPPEAWMAFSVPAQTDDSPVNHPGNLRNIYLFAAEWLQIPSNELEEQVSENFQSMFAGVI